MKNAFRYMGIGFFLSGLVLFAAFKMNIDFSRFGLSLGNQTQVSQTVTSSRADESSTAANTTAAETTTTTSQTTSAASTGTVTLTVSQDDDSYTVGQRLLEMGIISNVDAFSDYMAEHNLAGFIQTGTFTINRGVSLEELGQILTTYPGN